MKDFTDLTDEEMLALDQDQIDRYIDLAAAEQGVELLPSAPIAPPSIDANLDVVAYSIGSYTFTDKQHALNVRDEILKSKSRVRVEYAGGAYAYSGPRKIVKDPSDEVEVTEARYLSEDNAAARAGQIADHEEAKARYQKERTAYDRIVLWRQKTRTPIVEAIREARARRERNTFIVNEHARYLALADGNRRIAARFLKSAHPDADTVAPDLFVFTPKDAPLPRKYQDEEGHETPRPERVIAEEELL